MPRPFIELRERLLRSGVAPRYVRRYLAELSDHLADLTSDGVAAGKSQLDAEAAAFARIGTLDELSRAMTEQPRLQAWSVRAPWAIYGLAPLSLLAGVYFISCFILWSGWEIFLPGTDTPFVPISGFAIAYFGVGKWLYFGAPILVGSGIGIVAGRQRSRVGWPTVGIAMIALVASTAQVHAIRSLVPGGPGRVGMDFGVVPSVDGVAHLLMHAMAVLSLSLVPWLLLRFGNARPVVP